MRKFFKRITFIFIECALIFSYCIIAKAWTAPTIKEAYVEEDVEFRAVWVCTVSNMDMKKQMGTDEASINEWKQQYLTILDNATAMHLNGIIFQVRPCNDAFYPSKYNPWSEYLVGFGVNPGWDPLAWMIEVTHERGLEYHAWLNPYRCSTGSPGISLTTSDKATGISYINDFDTNAIQAAKDAKFNELARIATEKGNVVDNPIFKTGNDLHEGVVLGTEDKYVLNPAKQETITHLENTITELVDNYDIDGIHFDDYFYPATSTYKGTDERYKGFTYSTEPNYDLDDYNAYKENGGTLNIYDWRRDNVDRLIYGLSTLIRTKNQTKTTKCAFGISPSAHFAPSIESCPAGSERGAEGGENASCNGYYSYSDLYANTRKWVKENWLDYILPQNYTNLGSAQAGIPTGTYTQITSWWSNCVKDTNCLLYIGTGVYRLDEWASQDKATSSELFYQMKYNQSKKMNQSGYVMFRYEDLTKTNGKLAIEQVAKYLWKKQALTPNYQAYTYEHLTVTPVIKTVNHYTDNDYSILFDKVAGAKAYAVLEDDKVIARCLTDEELFFKVKEGSNYSFVIYGADNTYDEKTTINLTEAKENAKPVIVKAPTIEKEYLLMTKINLEFEVMDEENDPMTYSLSCFQNSKEYVLAKDQKVVDGKITCTYECFAIPMENFKFVLTVSDNLGSTVYETSTFNVVKELSTDPNEEKPTDPEENDKPNNPGDDPSSGNETKDPQSDSKKCKKKNDQIMALLMSIATLNGLIILLKKRK